MGAWIMSVVGVICLGVLLEIVLPSGKTTKYIRGAFSLLVVFVIASVIPKIANADGIFDFEDIFSPPDSSVSASLDAQKFAEEKVQIALQNEGCEGNVQVNMSGTVVSDVRVSVRKSIIGGERIVEIAAQTLGVSKRIIRVVYSDKDS